MRWTIFAPVVSIAALAAMPAAASVSDFRLPAPSTQQPDTDRQGPVAPDVPESRAPRPTPTPSASRAPAPLPSPTAAAPQVEVPDLAPAQSETRAARTRAPAPAASADEAPVASSETASAPIASATAPIAAPSPTPSATARPAKVLPAQEGGSFAWLWAVLAVAVLAAGAFVGWRWWGQRSVAGPVKIAPVERPRTTPAPPPAEPIADPEPLQVALEPLRLSLTLMNATLAYRLEIANRGPSPIEGLRIGADMISAHASMSREQQLSGPGPNAATVQQIERLEPGESRLVEGEFRVPFSQIMPIRQGNAALLLPLARFRLEAEGTAPVVRTFVVGQPGANQALQPFRLDLGPRVYPTLAQRAFA